MSSSAESIHLQTKDEFLEALLRAMREPVDSTPCCELDGRAMHHHWKRAS